MSKNTKLTSVKVDPEKFEDFQIECVKRKYSFTKMVNVAIHLFNKDDEFRRKIINTKLPE